MNFFSGKKILIISPEAWGGNFVSKHHYARVLTQLGATVFFLEPPADKKRVRTIAGIDGLHVLSYRNHLRGINELPLSVRAVFLRWQIKRLAQMWNNNLDIVWSFDPFRFQNLKQFGAPVSIYHPVDIHHTRREEEIAQSSDMILTSSQALLKRFERFKKPKYNVGHGLAETFAKIRYYTKDDDGTQRIKVGYVGNLHYKFLDAELLKYIIQQNAQADFYFIGPYEKSNLSATLANSDLINWLRDQSNVHLIGPVPSVELASYLRAYDVFLICYTAGQNTDELANPHKVLEYLSTGKVVVSSYIEEYKDKQGLLEMATARDRLPDIFARVIQNLKLHNDVAKATARMEFANANTYFNKLNQIAEYIARL